MEQPRHPFNPQAEIAMLKQQAMVEGAVDSEPSDYDGILNKLNSHTMSAEDALREAQAIADKRQNYH